MKFIENMTSDTMGVVEYINPTTSLKVTHLGVLDLTIKIIPPDIFEILDKLNPQTTKLIINSRMIPPEALIDPTKMVQTSESNFEKLSPEVLEKVKALFVEKDGDFTLFDKTKENIFLAFCIIKSAINVMYTSGVLIDVCGGSVKRPQEFFSEKWEQFGEPFDVIKNVDIQFEQICDVVCSAIDGDNFEEKMNCVLCFFEDAFAGMVDIMNVLTPLIPKSDIGLFTPELTERLKDDIENSTKDILLITSHVQFDIVKGVMLECGFSPNTTRMFSLNLNTNIANFPDL